MFHTVKKAAEAFQQMTKADNPVLSCDSKIDITKIIMTNGSLMKVGSIAEYSPWGILQYF